MLKLYLKDKLLRYCELIIEHRKTYILIKQQI